MVETQTLRRIIAKQEFKMTMIKYPILRNPILRQIYTDEIIKIGWCSGTRTIAGSQRTFRTYIKPDFTQRDFNYDGSATKEIEVSIYEQTAEVSRKQMFEVLNPDLDKLCLTQHQIVRFCDKQRDRIYKDGITTHFLFKKDSRFLSTKERIFIIIVYMDFVGLGVTCRELEYSHRISRLEGDDLWGSTEAERLVVPKLIA